MEALLFALIAARKAYRRQEAFVPEPYRFQAFDLRVPKHLYNAKDKSQSWPSDRQESYVAQSLS
jgi:hypothetical protein